MPGRLSDDQAQALAEGAIAALDGGNVKAARVLLLMLIDRVKAER